MANPKSGEEEIPKHIADFKKHREKAKRIGDTTELAHSEAYTTAAKAVLEKDGEIDYKLLDQADVREKFVDKMTDFYLTKANAHFGTKIKKDEVFKVNQLLTAYGALTKEELRTYVDRHKKKYTLGTHENHRDELIKKVRQRLNSVAGSHLKDEHIDDIVKHISAGNIVDTKRMTIEDAKQLYGLHENYGALTTKMIEEQYVASGLDSPIFLKKEKETKKAA